MRLKVRFDTVFEVASHVGILIKKTEDFVIIFITIYSYFVINMAIFQRLFHQLYSFQVRR